MTPSFKGFVCVVIKGYFIGRRGFSTNAPVMTPSFKG